MNLLKSLAAVSSMTMFSRVLGFARDAIVARIFGAGMATDAFFVAFKLPNLLRRIFAEGAFSQAFVPILAEYKSKQGEDATRVFVSYVSGLLTLALAVVTVAGMLAAPWVIMVTAPGFADTADKFALTSQLLKITFPYILLISLASLVGAILNTWNRFSIPAFARLVRGNTLVLKQQTFIESARSIGASDATILFNHILPGTVSSIVVYFTMRIGVSIISAASLSFLGLGAQPPTPEWGAMLNEARADMVMSPHVALFPAVAIFVTVLAFNLLGDGLRDALDPKLKG